MLARRRPRRLCLSCGARLPHSLLTRRRRRRKQCPSWTRRPWTRLGQVRAAAISARKQRAQSAGWLWRRPRAKTGPNRNTALVLGRHNCVGRRRRRRSSVLRRPFGADSRRARARKLNTQIASLRRSTQRTGALKSNQMHVKQHWATMQSIGHWCAIMGAFEGTKFIIQTANSYLCTTIASGEAQHKRTG